MKVLVVGAHGATGRLVLGKLVEGGHEVRGMVRDPIQGQAIRELGAAPLAADLTRAETLPAALDGRDAVIFAAGSKGRDLDNVDRDGAIRLANACGPAGVRRFVMLSSFFAGRPDEGPEKIRAYLRAKRVADDHLLASGLDVTIVRPGWLTNDEETGRIVLADSLDDETASISRADVAGTLAAALDLPATVGRIFEIASGPAPIREALAGLS